MRGAVLAVLVLLSLAGCRGGSSPGREVRGVEGWTLRVPGGLHVERSGVESRITIHEVTVASFVPRRGVHVHTAATSGSIGLVPPRDRSGRFPSDGVALRIVRMEGGPAFIPGPGRDTRLPIRLAGLRPQRFTDGRRPRPREVDLTGDGLPYQVLLWTGPKATPQSRAELAQTLRSLAFPRLRQGQALGYARVLGVAKSYPVGSFTPVGRNAYLVHAPGGFYSIHAGQGTGGYASRCRLVVAQGGFLCSNLDARWDHLGRVLAKPHGASRGDALWFSPAHVTSDGHVLLFAESIAPVDRGTAARLWPTRVVKGPGSSRVVVPRALHVERSGTGEVRELTVASFPLGPGIHTWRKGPDSGSRMLPPGGPSGRFPADGIAFRILQADIGPGLAANTLPTSLPLSLRDFAPSDLGPRVRQEEAIAGGEAYELFAWTGPAATPARRAELARIVSSVAFPGPRRPRP